jgi:lipopolysaccharide export LptBFGC system permease protein LptF
MYNGILPQARRDFQQATKKVKPPLHDTTRILKQNKKTKHNNKTKQKQKNPEIKPFPRPVTATVHVSWWARSGALKK